MAASASHLQAILEAVVDAILGIDERGVIQMVNPAAEQLFGYAENEVIGQNVKMLMPPPHRDEHDGYLARYLTTREKRIIGIGREAVGQRKDGTTFPMDLSVAEARLGDERLFVGIIRDITERKCAEEALRQSEARLREQAQVLDLSQVMVRDLDSRILLWSQGMAQLYGWSHDEAIGHISHTLLRTELPLPFDTMLLRLQDQGEWQGELVRFRKDGARLVVSSHWVLYRDEKGVPRAILEADYDITERKQAEEALNNLLAELQTKNEEVRTMTQQLWQAAKLASVGELAASIAHELNNPLATVSLRVESVLARTPAEDPRRRALEVVDQETKRMGELVANLLQFARRGAEQISTVDIRQELAKAIELIHHHLRKRRITVDQKFASDTPTIYADRQKLRQVLLNLLTNASDAMPEGGTLTVGSEPAILANGEPAVRIEVSDTGKGIPAEHLDKVFDSFFSTKEEGKGTGLGLAICRRIVEEHHGTIEITSVVGKGTTVRIMLPVKNGANVKHLASQR